MLHENLPGTQAGLVPSTELWTGINVSVRGDLRYSHVTN